VDTTKYTTPLELNDGMDRWMEEVSLRNVIQGSFKGRPEDENIKKACWGRMTASVSLIHSTSFLFSTSITQHSMA
jgi:hypothetical protein